MSDELVNQLTLNFLISKHQLQKLNKKIKEDIKEDKMNEIKLWSYRLKMLFNDLLVNAPPDDLLIDVKNAFDNFVDKSIYYFKAHDNTIALENQRNSNDIIQDDIDYEKEEREIEKGNYKEQSNNESDEDSNDESYEDEQNYSEIANDGSYEDNNDSEEDTANITETNIKTSKLFNHDPIIVTRKYHKKTTSTGVDDIQKLPLDWFENVRQNYKKNQIIPRKKEPTIVSSPDPKKKI